MMLVSRLLTKLLIHAMILHRGWKLCRDACGLCARNYTQLDISQDLYNLLPAYVNNKFAPTALSSHLTASRTPAKQDAAGHTTCIEGRGRTTACLSPGSTRCCSPCRLGTSHSPQVPEPAVMAPTSERKYSKAPASERKWAKAPASERKW